MTIPGLGVAGTSASVTIPASRAEWGVTIPANSRNRENAIAFVDSLLSSTGRRALIANGPAPTAARVARQDLQRLPSTLRALTKAD